MITLFTDLEILRILQFRGQCEILLHSGSRIICLDFVCNQLFVLKCASYNILVSLLSLCPFTYPWNVSLLNINCYFEINSLTSLTRKASYSKTPEKKIYRKMNQIKLRTHLWICAINLFLYVLFVCYFFWGGGVVPQFSLYTFTYK